VSLQDVCEMIDTGQAPSSGTSTCLLLIAAELRQSVAIIGPVRLSSNLYFSTCFFSWNSVLLSHQISEQYFQS
jgi:hypothetical protein